MKARHPAFAMDPFALARGEDVVGTAIAWACGCLNEQPILIYATAAPELDKGCCEMGCSSCSCSSSSSKSRPGRLDDGILSLAIRTVKQIITGENRIRFAPQKPNRSSTSTTTSTSTKGQCISQQALARRRLRPARRIRQFDRDGCRTAGFSRLAYGGTEDLMRGQCLGAISILRLLFHWGVPVKRILFKI